MDLTDKHKAILTDVITFFWQNGGVRSPQMAAGLQEVAMILFRPAPPVPPPQAPEVAKS